MDIPELAFCIAGFKCKVVCNFPIDLPALLPSYKPFLMDSERDDYRYNLRLSVVGRSSRLLETHPSSAGCDRFGVSSQDVTLLTDFEWEDARCGIYRHTGGLYVIVLAPHDGTHLYCLYYSPETHEARLFLGGTDERQWPFVLNNFLMMLFAFDSARYSELLVHASVVCRGNRAYMFLGRSGTGKSTHSRLWLEHIPGCRLLNDDNPVLSVYSTGLADVFGSPWSGKTPCYINDFCRLGGIVRLEQAPVNQITRLDPVHAFAAVLPSCSCLKQDEYIRSKVVEAVTRLSTDIPVYHLKCLPNADAALLCAQTVGALDRARR